MSLALLAQELRWRRRATVLWILGVAALVAINIAFYPAVRDNAAYDELVEQLPEALLPLLGGSDLTSTVGYLNSQLYVFFIPVVLLVLTIGRGAAAIAGEEEQHTLDVLIAAPISRWSLYLAKAAALVILTAAVVLFGVLLPQMALAEPVGLDLGWSPAIATSVQMLLFVLVLGVLAMGVAAATGRRSVGVAAAAGVATVGFLVDTLGRNVSWLGEFRWATPWRWYSGNDPLLNGWGMLEGSVLVLSLVFLLAAGAAAFHRRDLRS